MESVTRRAALGAIGSIAAAGLIAGHAARAASGADAAIEAAWERRQKAYHAYNALPMNDGPLIDGMTAEEVACWTIIDEAEEVIRTNIATTTRGAMLQLWCAMYHSISKSSQDDAVNRADFAALDSEDSEMDWNVRLMLAALRSLQAMEA